MSINKKAAATLISWVLMVGLTIALAGIVTNWAIKNVEKFDPETTQSQDIFCPVIAININSSCHLSNRGQFNLTNLQIRFTNGTTKTDELIPPINPGGKSLLNVIICSNVGTEVIPIMTTQEGKDVRCPEKRYEI